MDYLYPHYSTQSLKKIDSAWDYSRYTTKKGEIIIAISPSYNNNVVNLANVKTSIYSRACLNAHVIITNLSHTDTHISFSSYIFSYQSAVENCV